MKVFLVWIPPTVEMNNSYLCVIVDLLLVSQSSPPHLLSCAPALCRFCAAFTPENRDDQWVSHLSVHLNTTRSYLSYYNEHEWLKSGFNDLKPVGIMTQRMRRWNKGESRDAPRFSCDSHNMFSALFDFLKVMPSCWEWCWVVSHWR